MVVLVGCCMNSHMRMNSSARKMEAIGDWLNADVQAYRDQTSSIKERVRFTVQILHGLALGPLIIMVCAMQVTSTQESSWHSQFYPQDWQPPQEGCFIEDTFIQDFSYAGYHRGERPLPQIEGPVFAVKGIDPSGQMDATVAIQAAIDNAVAAGGGVVQLPAGTFRLSVASNASTALHIHGSKVILRGKGAGETILVNHTVEMRERSVLLVSPPEDIDWLPKHPESVSITADLRHPSQEIPVAQTARFQVGDWVLLRADLSPALVDDLGMSDHWGSEEARLFLGGPLFYRQITAVDHEQLRIRIDAPTRWLLLTRDQARIEPAPQFLQEVGIEALSIGNLQHPQGDGWEEESWRSEENGAWHAHDAWLIHWRGVRDSWMRSVYSHRPQDNDLDVHMLANGVQLQLARGVTLLDVRMQRPQYGGGGGNGYAIRLSSAQECLVQDCHVAWNRHGFVFSGMQTSGNVIHGGSASFTRWQGAGSQRTNGQSSDHHMHLSQSNLIDGVTLDGDFFHASYRYHWGNPAHALTATQVVYWNLYGQRSNPDSDLTWVVQSGQFGHGYVIGTRGEVNGVRLDEHERTQPMDHLEGEGEGDRLVPQSLYNDQVQRRLGQ
ncbi:MAG: hypothetical protein EA401_04415 [Planctomycetota bacterium]|nr:MAG: hypothetical protein EA401_04415 [Planctomycetota bacterium]